MKNFAFISRHEPTNAQELLAAKQGIILTHVGDYDGFTIDAEEFSAFDGAVVVHAAAALRLFAHMPVGVFNNVNRAAVGEKPEFKTVELYVYSSEVEESIIPDAGMSVRVLNNLAAEGYTTVAQVRAATDLDLLKLPNIGKKALRSIREATSGIDGACLLVERKYIKRKYRSKV